MQLREILDKSSWSPLEASLGLVGALLGSSGTFLRPFLGHLASLFWLLGARLDYRGSLLHYLGSLLDFPCIVLPIFHMFSPCRQLLSLAQSCHLGCPTWALLGPSWVHLGRLWVPITSSCAPLGPLGDHLGLLWDPLGPQELKSHRNTCVFEGPIQNSSCVHISCEPPAPEVAKNSSF